MKEIEYTIKLISAGRKEGMKGTGKPEAELLALSHT